MNDTRFDPEAEVKRIFGPVVPRDEVASRAIQSNQLYVRSQTQLTFWSRNALGRALTAFECLQAFGRRKMAELADSDIVIFVQGPVGLTLRTRRMTFGIEPSDVVRKLERDFGTSLSVDDLIAMEEGDKTIPAKLLTRLARVYALDRWRIGTEDPDAVLDGFAAKLRALQRRAAADESPDRLSVLDLAEAGWMISTQATIAGWLDTPQKPLLWATPSYVVSDRLGAWENGRAQAAALRRRLNIPDASPIADINSLCEDRLGVPVVRMRIDEGVAGAALANAGARGIVVNVAGINRNPGTFRITVAHELCHILLDELDTVYVDQAFEIDAGSGGQGVPSAFEEFRAQAFAAELLAPSEAAFALFKARGESREALAHVMDHFGVSYTCARRQILEGATDPDYKVVVGSLDAARNTSEVFSTTSRWRAQAQGHRRIETADFDRLCRQALDRNLISQDTLADLLCLDMEEARKDQKLPYVAALTSTTGSSSSPHLLSEAEWTVLFDVYAKTRGNLVARGKELAAVSALFRAMAGRREWSPDKGFRSPDGLRRRLKVFEELATDTGLRLPPAAALAVWIRYRNDFGALADETDRIRAEVKRRR